MRTTESDLACTDPTLAGREHGLLSQDAVQLQPGAFRARCTIAHIGPLRIVFHASEARVRTRTATRHGRLAIVLFGPRARGTVEGLAVRPDLFLAAGPGAEAGFVAEPGWETVTFLIDPASLRSQAAARTQAQVLRMPTGLEIRRGDGAAIRHLFESGRRCAEAAATDSPSPGQPETVSDATTLAGAVDATRCSGAVDAIADLLADSTLYRPSRREFGAMRRSGIVRNAEAHALAKAGERIHLSDLCRATAVSERTLEYAFQTTMGLSPVAYLTMLRLHRARASLQRPPGSRRTIAATAADWGFGHLGEFAQAYRQQFGESPSRTRAVPDAGPPADGQRAGDPEA